jgi:hypothetical protein
MKCEKDKGIITDYISEQLTGAEKTTFESHLARCTDCQEELEIQRHVWKMLDKSIVPSPSSRLDNLDPFFILPAENNRLWMKIAAAFILVVTGFGAGYLVNRPQPVYSYQQQVDSLSGQVHDMREMMMLSLLENPSASERIRAVSFTSELNKVNAKLINALLTTLNNDPNVNVRLMTLEALMHYAANPAVREGLVQSIVRQESPLMQSAMADAMITMQEKSAVQPFKKLLQQKQINIQVRTKIEQTISRLT